MKRKAEGFLNTMSKTQKSFDAFALIDTFFNDSFSVPSLDDVNIRELFNPLSDFPIFRGNHAAHPKLVGQYVIHTTNSLGDLLLKSRRFDKQATVELRFLLTPKFELLFASEGLTNSTIPPHFAMTGLKKEEARCITAGVISFNSDNKIIGLSHQSGCFRPSWESLQYALFALLACGVPFAQEIQLQNATTFLTVNALTSELMDYIEDTFSPEHKAQCQTINSKLDNKTYQYGVLPKHVLFKGDAITPKPEEIQAGHIEAFREKTYDHPFELKNDVPFQR